MGRTIGFVVALLVALPGVCQSQDQGFVGFGAIPLDVGRDLMDEKVARSLRTRSGAMVSFVAPDSPAADAGIRSLDVITVFNGEKVGSADELHKGLLAIQSGDEFSVRVFRPSPAGRRIVWRSEILKGEASSELQWARKVTATSRDDISGRVSTVPSSTPSIRVGTGLYAHVQSLDGTASSLWLRVYYSGSDWLFMDSVTIIAGDKKYENRFGTSQATRDNGIVGGSARVWEYVDIQVGKDLRAILDLLAAFETPAMIRISGTDYKKDHEIDVSEALALRAILVHFDNI